MAAPPGQRVLPALLRRGGFMVLPRRGDRIGPYLQARWWRSRLDVVLVGRRPAAAAQRTTAARRQCSWDDRDHYPEESDAQPARRAIHQDHPCGREAAGESEMMFSSHGRAPLVVQPLPGTDPRFAADCSRPVLAQSCRSAVSAHWSAKGA